MRLILVRPGDAYAGFHGPIAGPQIVADMANGAEAYLQMWARADAAKTQ